MRRSPRPVPWLAAGEHFPPLETAWGAGEPAPGLLAAGGALDVETLQQAYCNGIFPWFSPGQPILWWSPDPRMVLRTEQFKLHRSLKKKLARFADATNCKVTFDTAFTQVINACAGTPRDGQPGTWIVPDMIEAYSTLHRAGYAHSVETWVDGVLVGGLYCVNMGAMVFGESMFAHQTDASKVALAALVAFCLKSGIEMIDCQQNTRHLAFLGAAEVPRAQFISHVQSAVIKEAPQWHFEPVYWNYLLTAHRDAP